MKAGAGAALLLAALLAGCRDVAVTSSPSRTGEERAATRTAQACAGEAASALAARDMRRLAEVVGKGERVAFTPFGFARPADVSLRAEELEAEVRDGNARDWGTLGESDDPLRLPFADYLARYGWDAAYVVGGPRSAGSAGFDAASNDIAALLAAIRALHPGADITEYQRPPSAPAAMDWRVLRLVCVPGPSGFRLARVVHSEWTP